MSAPAFPETLCVHAACLRGVEAVPVTVEVSMGSGIPGISIVGLQEGAAMDARTRIRCAIRGRGYEMPRRSLTVNLAPGDLRKSGSAFDLPILVAILAISGQIPLAGLDGCLFAGELGLSGEVKPVRGEVAYALLCRDLDLMLVTGFLEQHVPIADVPHRFLTDIGRLRAGLDDGLQGFALLAGNPDREGKALDFSDVVGQEVAKRGMAIAATGNLGLLMVGPPGAGKSMLARRFSTILPPIDPIMQQEALCINSVAGEDVEELLLGQRPFRDPHHSISTAGLVGGGRPVRPGEASLAHGGTLFLDELAEFPNNVLQLLRQPLEERKVRIVRAEGAYTFPASFQLLAASNPCPCGYLGDREVACTCSASAVQRYQQKLAGPLIDRIDLMIDVSRPDPQLIVEGATGLSSADLRAAVERGRAFRDIRIRRRRAAGLPWDERTATGDEGIIAVHGFSDRGAEVLLAVAHRNHLTGRGISRLCRIARTIADISESMEIDDAHVLEASMFQGRRFDACG